jgi:hypothetical protein
LIRKAQKMQRRSGLGHDKPRTEDRARTGSTGRRRKSTPRPYER